MSISWGKIYFRGKFAKNIYYNGNYYNQVYIGGVNGVSGQPVAIKAWQKLKDSGCSVSIYLGCVTYVPYSSQPVDSVGFRLIVNADANINSFMVYLQTRAGGSTTVRISKFVSFECTGDNIDFAYVQTFYTYQGNFVCSYNRREKNGQEYIDSSLDSVSTTSSLLSICDDGVWRLGNFLEKSWLPFYEVDDTGGYLWDNYTNVNRVNVTVVSCVNADCAIYYPYIPASTVGGGTVIPAQQAETVRYSEWIASQTAALPP